MTENARLLTQKELWAVDYSSVTSRGEERLAFCKAQDAKTLRVVEKWLNSKTSLTGAGSYLTAVGVYHEFRKAFLEGEMPGDAP